MENKDINKYSSQYNQYDRIPLLLKRYSLKEKMRVATYHSCETIQFNKKMRQIPRKPMVLPWCLETFVMLSLEAKEFQNDDFRGKNEAKFNDMCNAIWEETSFVTDLSSEDFTFLDFYLPATALTQFHLQEVNTIRQYRYWTIFNDSSEPVNLKEIFKAKMGAEYNDFLLLGRILQALFIAQSQDKRLAILPKILPFLLNRFSDVAKKLMISRTDYITLQNRFTDQTNKPYSYLYSLCPSYQYTFISEDDVVFFPLPHLLDQNITSSLMFRLTEGDNKLRRDIGKYILEKYLFNLVNDTGIYEEVFPEKKYKYKGTQSNSPDVLARQGKSVLFIDSKSTVPAIGIRLFDVAAYEKNIGIVAENIKKLYQQIKRFKLYNPFLGEVQQSEEDYWGIVVVLEDSFIQRGHYYKKACEILDIVEDSDEWKWIRNHIKVVSLYEVECICICGFSLIEAFKHVPVDSPIQYPFFMDYPPKGSPFIDKKFLEFKENIDMETNKIIGEIKAKGLFL